MYTVDCLQYKGVLAEMTESVAYSEHLFSDSTTLDDTAVAVIRGEFLFGYTLYTLS